jgi:hypothetical protein
MHRTKATIVISFAIACLAGSSLAQASQPIVGSWLLDAGGSLGVVSFLEDGRYVEAMSVAGDSVHTGIEWGNYTWNEVTGAITATSMGDTNGDWGFAGDVNGTQYLTVSGNVGTVFQPGCSDCTGSVSRILPAPVPEPETYGMLLAGLGLVGVAARRRKQAGA